MNEKALEFFEDMANNPNSTQTSLKMAKNGDFTDLDAKFILKYADKNSSLLDLGSGTGLIINKIYDKVGKIIAVEPLKKFTNYIVRSNNIKIINETFDKFDTDETFDAITLFGVMHYFNQQEARFVYTKFLKNLKMGGHLIIKNQFGVKETVTISGFSQELKKDYFAQYRFVEDEEKLLKECGYKYIERSDIYPPECNRWDNTHFYAIVATP